MNGNAQDALIGSVREVRIERSSFSEKVGEFVEGQRILSQVSLYDRAGRLMEVTKYSPEGGVVGKSVYTYDSEEKLTEVRESEGGDSFISKITGDSSNRAIEYVLESEGSILPGINKVIYEYDSNGNNTSMSTYDYLNNPLSSLISVVNTKGHTGEFTFNDSDNSLIGKGVISLDIEGNAVEVASYDAGGSLIKKISYTYNDKGMPTEVIEYNASGSILSKDTYNYEFDKQGNWIKKTKLSLDSETAILKPVEVIYRDITYIDL